MKHWSMLLVMLATVISARLASAAETTVRGWDFEVVKLEDGARAFLNRNYVWRELPEDICGWQFTRLGGGVRTRLTACVDQDGPVYLITGATQEGINLDGWQRVPDWSFYYSTKHKTSMAVYVRDSRQGELVEVPQGNWTGGIVVAPKLAAQLVQPTPDHSKVPGVIIDYAPAALGRYIGCPSIAVLPDGTYIASHSFFGPRSKMRITSLHRSRDRGQTWDKLTEIDGQWWSTLFLHRSKLYIIGVTERYGHVAIRRSDDGGRTWTEPKDMSSGLLLDDAQFHCAPVPVVVHAGRIWRAMEDAEGGGGWAEHFRAFMMSAAEDANLLDAANWTFSNRVASNTDWLNGTFRGWLEGNAVVTPQGRIVNILRIVCPPGGKGAVVQISDDGTTASFDPTDGFVDLPGGAKKFSIRFDRVSKQYWSLTNWIPEKERLGRVAGGVRNTLALICSADLKDWTVRSVLLHNPDQSKHGFQYVDWLFDGQDMIAVSRTAFDDRIGGAHNFHDANYYTFHRITDFRDREIDDPPLD
ncbi:MAG: sialidase family protein [Pirellulales bacterium]